MTPSIRPQYIPDEKRRVYQDKLKAQQELATKPLLARNNGVTRPNRHITKIIERVKSIVIPKKVAEPVIEQPVIKTFSDKLNEAKARLAQRQSK